MFERVLTLHSTRGLLLMVVKKITTDGKFNTFLFLRTFDRQKSNNLELKFTNWILYDQTISSDTLVRHHLKHGIANWSR
jgi:hypothetical protein